jgi:hypothetical protein
MAPAVVVNVVFNEVPTSCTAAIIATAIPAAIKPYSMAVAPDSFFMKREMNLYIDRLPSEVAP